MKMIKALTEELTKDALNYAVAIASGFSVAELEGHDGSLCVGDVNNQCIGILRGVPVMTVFKYGYYDPSNKWEIGGPIIEREKIRVEPDYPNGWVAQTMYHGSTLLEAAMRCFVTNKLGSEIEIPEKLLA